MIITISTEHTNDYIEKIKEIINVGDELWVDNNYSLNIWVENDVLIKLASAEGGMLERVKGFIKEGKQKILFHELIQIPFPE